MNDKQYIRKELIAFRDCDKYATYVDLQPAVANSTSDTKAIVEEEMMNCCNQLLAKLDGFKLSDDGMKSIIRISIEQIEDAMLDTEDREFCYELYAIMGKIIGIDIQDHSISVGEKLKQDTLRLIEKGGINISDLPPGFMEKLNQLK